MGVRNILLCLFWISVFTGMTILDARATPPKSVNLSYDVLGGMLYVEAEHVTDNVDKHYLHTMKIFVNDKEVQTLYFHRQNQPTGFKEDVPLVAQPTDMIRVELFCIQGGSNKAEITIPEEAAK